MFEIDGIEFKKLPWSKTGTKSMILEKIKKKERCYFILTQNAFGKNSCLVYAYVYNEKLVFGFNCSDGGGFVEFDNLCENTLIVPVEFIYKKEAWGLEV